MAIYSTDALYERRSWLPSSCVRSARTPDDDWMAGLPSISVRHLLDRYTLVELVDRHGWHFQWRRAQFSGNPPAGATGAAPAVSPFPPSALGTDAAPVQPSADENARASLTTTPGPESGSAVPDDAILP